MRIAMLLSLAAMLQGAQGQGPPLDLVEVSIAEGRVDATSPMRNRPVTFTFVLSAPPVCDASTDGVKYAVFVDADMQEATGTRLPDVPGLGVERQVVARCDGASGRYVSRSGDVSVTGAPGAGGRVELRIGMRLSQLPSTEFTWVGMVRHGDRFRLAPDGPPAHWGITERLLW